MNDPVSRIKAHLGKKGISQVKFSEKAGIASGLLSQILSGKMRITDVTAKKIAVAAGWKNYPSLITFEKSAKGGE